MIIGGWEGLGVPLLFALYNLGTFKLIFSFAVKYEANENCVVCSRVVFHIICDLELEFS